MSPKDLRKQGTVVALENKHTPWASLTPVEHTLSAGSDSDSIGPKQLLQMLMTELKRCPLAVLALSHTHYLTITGGTENVIAAESAAILEAGWSYIHICPLLPTDQFFEEKTTLGQLFVLTINGRKMGMVYASLLADVIDEIQREIAAKIRLVVHHLIGFELHSVLSVARACGNYPTTLWVHDFFTLCIDPFLMRNDVQFCGAPNKESTACLVCSKGRARKMHMERMSRLLRELKPSILSPSAALLQLWTKHNDYEVSDSNVVPLASIVLGKPSASREYLERPLHVAYLGSAVWRKGWHTFQKLVNLLHCDSRYKFYRFGYGVSRQECIEEINVVVTSEDPNAMIRTVAKHEVDVVVNWSECYESFSFVTCEALAAGASIVARMGAGNVPHLIQSVDANRGVIFHTEDELLAFFASGKALSLKGKRLNPGYVKRTTASANRLLSDELF